MILLVAWLAYFVVLLASAYAARWPALLGKRADGGFAWWGWPVAGPLLLLWHLLRLLSREPCCHEVAPGIWLGRRPLKHELPSRIDLVVDLVAEMPTAQGVAQGREYVSLPTLDAAAPPLAGLLDKLATHPGPIYIHCAQGHGRSAMVAAALLVRRGLAATPGEAVKMLKQARPGVRLNRWQWRKLRDCLWTTDQPEQQKGGGDGS